MEGSGAGGAAGALALIDHTGGFLPTVGSAAFRFGRGTEGAEPSEADMILGECAITNKGIVIYCISMDAIGVM